MLCAPLDGHYAELPSPASDAVLCTHHSQTMSKQHCSNAQGTAINLYFLYNRQCHMISYQPSVITKQQFVIYFFASYFILCTIFETFCQQIDETNLALINIVKHYRNTWNLTIKRLPWIVI